MGKVVRYSHGFRALSPAFFRSVRNATHLKRSLTVRPKGEKLNRQINSRLTARMTPESAA